MQGRPGPTTGGRPTSPTSPTPSSGGSPRLPFPGQPSPSQPSPSQPSGGKPDEPGKKDKCPPDPCNDQMPNVKNCRGFSVGFHATSPDSACRQCNFGARVRADNGTAMPGSYDCPGVTKAGKAAAIHYNCDPAGGGKPIIGIVECTCCEQQGKSVREGKLYWCAVNRDLWGDDRDDSDIYDD